jgi:hypothetical protein
MKTKSHCRLVIRTLPSTGRNTGLNPVSRGQFMKTLTNEQFKQYMKDPLGMDEYIP